MSYLQPDLTADEARALLLAYEIRAGVPTSLGDNDFAVLEQAEARLRQALAEAAEALPLAGYELPQYRRQKPTR